MGVLVLPSPFVLAAASKAAAAAEERDADERNGDEGWTVVCFLLRGDLANLECCSLLF